MTFFNIKHNAKIMTDDYPGHQSLKNELVPLLENYSDIQDRNTRVKGTMTEWNWLPERMCVQELKLYVLKNIKKHYTLRYTNTEYTDDNVMNHVGGVVVDFWGNVYHKGDYAESHKHWPHHYGFVYFLKSKWYNSPLVFNDSGKRIFPKEGTYVLFPSYFLHHVPKHRFNETRMTLSGNLV